MHLLYINNNYNMQEDFFVFNTKAEAFSFMEKLWSNAVINGYVENGIFSIRTVANLSAKHSFIKEDNALVVWNTASEMECVKFHIKEVKNYLNYQVKEEIVAAYAQEHFFGGSSYHVIYRLPNGKYRNYYDGREVEEIRDNYLKSYIGTAGEFNSLVEARQMLLKHRPDSELEYNF